MLRCAAQSQGNLTWEGGVTSSKYPKSNTSAHVGSCLLTVSPPPPLAQSSTSLSWMYWAAAAEHLQGIQCNKRLWLGTNCGYLWCRTTR